MTTNTLPRRTPLAASAGRAAGHKAGIRWSQSIIVLCIQVVAFTVLAVSVNGFFSQANLLSLLQTVSILGILGLGMAIVVIGRGIDLSVIATLIVPPALFLQMVQDGTAAGTALAACVCLALAIGLLNGWLIAYAEVSPLFVTLATGLLLAGLGQAKFFTLEIIQWPTHLGFLRWLGEGSHVLGIPNSVVVFGCCAAVVGFFLRWTRVGRFVYATGDNPAAARLVGIPTRPITVLQYVLAAFVAMLAGLVLAASVGSTTTRLFNSTMVYDVILVVVIGGIGLAGGRGGVVNVLLGTVLIGTLINAMTILDLPYTIQNLIKGGVLLAAILLDSVVNPRNEETAQQGDI